MLGLKKKVYYTKLLSELISRAHFILSTPISRMHAPRELMLLKQRVREGREKSYIRYHHTTTDKEFAFYSSFLCGF